MGPNQQVDDQKFRNTQEVFKDMPHSPDFQYYEAKSSQMNSGQKQMYNIIEEEPSQQNRSYSDTKQSKVGHNRNATHVTNENDETVFDTGHTKKYKQVNPESRTHQRKPRTNQVSINPPFDSFSKQLGNISKLETPEKEQETC